MRKHVLVVAVVVLATTAGCVGSIPNSFTFESGPATVSEDALSEHGYGNETINNITVNETFEVQNNSYTVEITNRQVQYEKQQSNTFPGAAMFTTFSTPGLSVMGQSVDPLQNMSNEAVIGKVLNESGAFENLAVVEEQSVVVLGNETTVTTFEGTVSGGMSGGGYELMYEQKVYIHATQVSNENDHIVALGIHPKEMNEKSSVLSLMESLEHGEE